MQNTKNLKFSDQGASEVLGGIMLISVVVLAVAIVGVMLTSQAPPEKIPAVDAVISNYGRTIQIYHNGGDSLQKSEMAILLDGVETAFLKGTDPSWTTWTAGESLVYNVPGSGDMPKVVRIIFKGGGGSTVLATADFSATGMINPGPLSPGTLKADFSGTPLSGNPPLVVQFSDSSAGSPVSWAWAFGDGGTSSLQNPSHIYLNKGTYSVSLTVMNASGSYNTLNRPNYIAVNAPGPVANFVGNPRAGPVPLTVYFVDTSTGSPTSWLWEFGDGSTSTVQNPSYQYKYTGTYTVNLTATNAGGSNKISQVNYISTTLSGPAVTAITPNSSTQTTPVLVTVAGNGFQTGANVTLVKSGNSDIIASSVNVVSGNLITCQFNLATVTPGQWDVVVTNTDDQSGTLASGFAVKNPKPTVTAITNTTGVRGWTVVERITGTNFLSGAVVKLVNASAGPDITATNVVVVSPTQINCYFDLTGAAPARRNVTVTNPSSDTGVGQNLFTVTSNAPTLTARNPTSGNRGWPVTIISLTGTGFQPGATVLIRRSGYADVVATGVNVASPTSINAGTLNLLGVQAGSWYYVVINPDGQASTSTTQTFTVNSNAPSVTLLTPNTGARGATVNINPFTGTNFQPGAIVNMTRTGTVIGATNVVVVSPTQITCTFIIPSGAPAGAYAVGVLNTDGRSVLTANRFTVTNPPPTISGISPTSGRHGVLVNPVIVTGTEFQAGARVRLYRGATQLYLAPAGTVTSTQITTSFNVGGGVSPGLADVRVTNPDGLYFTLANGYTVLD